MIDDLAAVTCVLAVNEGRQRAGEGLIVQMRVEDQVNEERMSVLPAGYICLPHSFINPPSLDAEC